MKLNWVEGMKAVAFFVALQLTLTRLGMPQWEAMFVSAVFDLTLRNWRLWEENP